jgi:hypothetical protein
LNEPKLAQEYLEVVIRMVTEFESDYDLYHAQHELPYELLRILDLKYGNLLDVATLAGQLLLCRRKSMTARS